jgi:hypothetical protein
MLELSEVRHLFVRDQPHSPAQIQPARRLSRLENWGRWVLRHWAEVAIEEGVFSREDIAGRPRLHAEACVILGPLCPADVRVELVPLEPLPDGHPLWHGKAMLSVAALRDGRCWFAVNTTADPADGDRRWTVRVRPARPLVGFSGAPGVARALERVPAGLPRRRSIRAASASWATPDMEVST